MNGIGFIVALPREIPTGFVRTNDQPEPSASPPCVTYRYTRGPRGLMAAQIGIGCTRAAELTRQFMAQYSPGAVVSLGFAGGLNPHLTPGTIVIATGLVSPDTSHVWAQAHKGLVEQFQAAAELERLPYHPGCLVSVSQVVAEMSAKARLWQACGADAVDMETAGIARAASEATLPWLALRAIVDTAVESVPVECLRLVDDAGQISMKALMLAVCHSPSTLRHVWRLAISSVVARRHLSRLVACWATRVPAERPLTQGLWDHENFGDGWHGVYRG